MHDQQEHIHNGVGAVHRPRIDGRPGLRYRLVNPESHGRIINAIMWNDESFLVDGDFDEYYRRRENIQRINDMPEEAMEDLAPALTQEFQSLIQEVQREEWQLADQREDPWDTDPYANYQRLFYRSAFPTAGPDAQTIADRATFYDWWDCTGEDCSACHGLALRYAFLNKERYVIKSVCDCHRCLQR